MRSSISGICGVFVVGAFCTAQVARAETIAFTASLDGAQVAPADECADTGSAATGSGTFTLDTVTGIVSYEITFSGLGSAESAAHVHGAADKCAGADIVYGLPPGSSKIGVSLPLTGQEQADMLADLHYVNIHSMGFPMGEIRGQIRKVGRVPALSRWGLVSMGLLAVGAGTLITISRRARVRAMRQPG